MGNEVVKCANCGESIETGARGNWVHSTAKARHCVGRVATPRAATPPSPLTPEEAKERAQEDAITLTKQFVNLAEGAIRQTDQMRQGHRSQAEIELLGRVLDEFDVAVESEFRLYGLPEIANHIASELMAVAMLSKAENPRECTVPLSGGKEGRQSEHLYDNSDLCVYCGQSRADNWIDAAAQQIWRLNDSIKYEAAHSREEIADIISSAYRAAVATVPSENRLYSGDLWLDSDGTANFKFHIEGGDFTAARHALEKFITCLQDKLNRAEDCPSAERVLNHCNECGKDFSYSYESTICPPCHGRIVGNEVDAAVATVPRDLRSRMVSLAADILKARTFDESDPMDEKLRLWAIEAREIYDATASSASSSSLFPETIPATYARTDGPLPYSSLARRIAEKVDIYTDEADTETRESYLNGIVAIIESELDATPLSPTSLRLLLKKLAERESWLGVERCPLCQWGGRPSGTHRSDCPFVLAKDAAIESGLITTPIETGWRDIASAPKNGRTLLLGYWNPSIKWRTVRGQWFTDEELAEWENGDDFEAGWFETSENQDEPPNCWPVTPECWMPLPSPPESRKS